MAAFAEYGTSATGAPYETWFADKKRRTGRSDEKHSLVTGSSIHGCHLDVSGICIAIGWCHIGPRILTNHSTCGHSGLGRYRMRGWTRRIVLVYQRPSTDTNGPFPSQKMSTSTCRIEMLNLGAEYVWLDVLCLRQVGGPGEDMRADEWKLDVPTIGAVYKNCKVVCYLSRLGRPLTVKEGDLESDRSWFRRAWTLQEAGEDLRVIAGDTPDGPLHAKCRDGKYETDLLTRFHRQLESTHQMSIEVREALVEMQKRVSTNPVDKIVGLAFLIGSRLIPAYYESESLEHAWSALVNSMHEWHRGELFFLYLEPGNAGKKWPPSWEQVMTKPLPANNLHSGVDRDDTRDEDSCDVWCIEKGFLRGLAVVEGCDRRGELIVRGEGGTEHEFEVTAAHAYPIPEDTYTIIYTCRFGHESAPDHWVVGRSLPGGKFQKVSTLEMSDEEWYRLKDWGITKRCRYVLI